MATKEITVTQTIIICDNCGEQAPTWRRDEQDLCAKCHPYFEACTKCNTFTQRGKLIRGADGSHYCSNCHSDLFTYCGDCGKQLAISETADLEDLELRICEECAFELIEKLIDKFSTSIVSRYKALLASGAL